MFFAKKKNATISDDKFLSGCILQHVTDLQVDVPMSRPVSLARGRRNDLRENAHSHHSQFRVPGLHVHSYHASGGIFAALAHTVSF